MSFMSIDQYPDTPRGMQYVPYDPIEDWSHFFKGDFRCKALPAARRRQQELTERNRGGIFLSHISEEQEDGRGWRFSGGVPNAAANVWRGYISDKNKPFASARIVSDYFEGSAT